MSRVLTLLTHSDTMNANTKLTMARSHEASLHGIVHRNTRAVPRACGLPPLLAGLAEDFTKQAPVCMRLPATGASGALALGGALSRFKDRL